MALRILDSSFRALITILTLATLNSSRHKKWRMPDPCRCGGAITGSTTLRDLFLSINDAAIIKPRDNIRRRPAGWLGAAGSPPKIDKNRFLDPIPKLQFKLNSRKHVPEAGISDLELLRIFNEGEKGPCHSHHYWFQTLVAPLQKNLNLEPWALSRARRFDYPHCHRDRDLV
jgi:hypothetical protein